MGTWFTVQGFGSYPVESRWEVDDYASLGSGFGDEVFQRLMREWSEFGDESRPDESCLLKSATDVAILEGS